MKKNLYILKTIFIAFFVFSLTQWIPGFLTAGESDALWYPLFSSVLLIGASFLVLYAGKIPFSEIAGKTFPGVPVYFILSAISLFLCNAGVSSLLESLFPGIMTGYVEFTSYLKEQSFYVLVINTCFLVPVGEEFLFRAFICRSLAKANIGKPTIIIISALFFSFIHFRMFQVLSAFLPGLILAWIFWESNNVLFPTGIHILQNCISLFLIYFHEDSINVKLNPFFYILMLVAGIILFLISVYMVEKIKNQSSSHSSKKKGKETSSANSSPLS